MRLRYAYFVTCREVVKNAAGDVIELRCTYDPATRGGETPPDGRKVKGTLHWVSAADAMPAEVRLYDPLFTDARTRAGGPRREPQSGLPASGDRAWLEPALAAANEPGPSSSSGSAISAATPTSKPGKPVFNRVVGLRDSYARQAARAGG